MPMALAMLHPHFVFMSYIFHLNCSSDIQRSQCSNSNSNVAKENIGRTQKSSVLYCALPLPRD